MPFPFLPYQIVQRLVSPVYAELHDGTIAEFVKRVSKVNELEVFALALDWKAVHGLFMETFVLEKTTKLNPAKKGLYELFSKVMAEVNETITDAKIEATQDKSRMSLLMNMANRLLTEGEEKMDEKTCFEFIKDVCKRSDYSYDDATVRGFVKLSL